MINKESKSKKNKTRKITPSSINTLNLVKVMNEQDQKVAIAVSKENKKIANTIDLCVETITNGGKIIYVGAGTPGRLGILDAVEMYPTYGKKNWIKAILAGGTSIEKKEDESAEDIENEAIKDLKKEKLSPEDIVIGITSSGSTPYTMAAVKYAKKIKAKSIAITTTANSKIAKLVDVSIEPVVGAEIILGSTRMKSGSAQKFVLNMISTGTMIKMERTLGNLMIDLRASNKKLVKRSINIIKEFTSLTYNKSQQLYEKSGQDIKVSIVMHYLKINKKDALKLLKIYKNSLSSLFRDSQDKLTKLQKRAATKALEKLNNSYGIFKINYEKARQTASKKIVDSKNYVSQETSKKISKVKESFKNAFSEKKNVSKKKSKK